MSALVPDPDVTAAADSAVAYLLAVADDALVYSHRLSQWVSRAPQLEEDVALANIALDLLGQARPLLTRAGELDGSGRGEDDLAMLRDERQFRNVHLVEQPVEDFGREMARLLWFAAFEHARYTALTASTDPVLAGVAGKAVKEAAYHLSHASTWVVRLGDGTALSRDRMAQALVWAAPYVPELLTDDEAGRRAAVSGVGVLPSCLAEPVRARVAAVVQQAGLELPEPSWRAAGGRAGIHSEAMGHLLATLQHIARSHPGASW